MVVCLELSPIKVGQLEAKTLVCICLLEGHHANYPWDHIVTLKRNSLTTNAIILGRIGLQ
jgi:hypothetical protein